MSLLRQRPSARDAVAGLVVSLVALSFYVSSATLMFQGPLAPHLSSAIGAALLGGFLLSVLGAWRGSQPLASLGPEPATVPVLAGISVGATAGLAGSTALATGVASLAVTALAMGLAWWLIGRRGAGHLIRFIPYPVIGGFLSSVGWLLLAGGLSVSMGRPLSPTLLDGSADAGLWQRLLVALGFGLLLAWGTLRIRHLLFLPGMLLLLSLAVHAGLALQGMGLDAARAQGWLMQPFAQALPWAPWQPGILEAIDWRAVLAQSGLVASAVIVATIGLLLSIGSLEVAIGGRADVNRDLRLYGLGNVACAALGAMGGGISISRSVANHTAGAVSAWAGLTTGLICLAAMFWGGPVIALVPKAVLGGLLVAIGLGMLKTWLVDSRPRLSTADFLTVFGMVGVTAVFGFLPAVFLGVLGCCVDFAVTSARLAPVRRMMTRATWPARVEYGPAQLEQVIAAGRRLHIIELQGVLFFGSVTRLVEQLEQLLAGPEAPSALVLDLRQVPWMDTSAGQALARLVREAGARGVTVDFSSVAPIVLRTLRSTGCLPPGGPDPHGDIELAVAAWDDRVLASLPQPEAERTLEGSLAADLGSRAAAEAVLARFEHLALAEGDVLFRQGDPPDALYIVQSGRLVASMLRDGRPVTMRIVLAGSAIGEMGLFRAAPRSATLTAEQPSRVLKLHRDRLRQLEADNPAQAAALYRLLIRQLASRLEQANAQANALTR